MKLEANQIENYAAGCFGGDVVDGAWYGRHIPEQLRAHYGADEAFRVRMACSTGVRLRFATDATRVRVGLCYGVRAREIFTSTLLVDGVEQAIFGSQEYASHWEDVIFEQSEATEHTFDLWLPNMAQTGVAALEFEGESYVEPLAAPAVRWLAYGDSITQGMTCSAPHRNHIARCALELDADAFNLGIGGAKLDKELSENITLDGFDIISIAYGTNDFNQNIPPRTFAENARALLGALREKTASPILLITPVTWAGSLDPNTGGHTLQDYRDVLHTPASEFENVTLVPGDTLIPDDSGYFVDNVHPNDEGFALYAQNLLTYLNGALGF